MTREKILSSLGEIVEESSAERVDWSSVTEATKLETLGFDSLSVLDLIFDVEQTTGVEMVVKDVISMQAVGELVTYIADRCDG